MDTPNQENKTKLNAFVTNMNTKNVIIERDQLLQEVAFRLKLDADLRFQFFMEHCKKYKSLPAFEEPQPFVHEIMEKTSADLPGVMTIISKLALDGRLQDLDEMLRATFPEYYFNGEQTL